MSVFVDTSAFLALLDADEDRYVSVRGAWTQLLEEAVAPVTTNYVLVETCAVLQRRLGMEAVRAFAEDIQPVLSVHWVTESEHEAGLAITLTAGRKGPSLVDCVSFEVMRRVGLKLVLTLDGHFTARGFDCIPNDS